MESHFFAMMSRMKYITRWALMRNGRDENISEHSLEVAMIAHGLATIGKVRYGEEVNGEKAALIALYHDSTEIITGDMPTPIKYYNPKIKTAFKEVEGIAAERLFGMLPEDLRPAYRELFFSGAGEEKLWAYVKAADKLSALIKCIEEEKNGNQEFVSARKALEASIDAMGLPEIDDFKDEFLPSYWKTLDELH